MSDDLKRVRIRWRWKEEERDWRIDPVNDNNSMVGLIRVESQE
jgi:hypothetical protein